MEKKNDKIIIIIVIATILVFSYLIFFNIKKNTKVEIEALVKETGNNYILVIDDEDNEYILNTTNKDKYNEGDKISAIIKNIKKGNPNTCETVKIDTISKNIIFEEKEETKEESTDDVVVQKPTESTHNDSNTTGNSNITQNNSQSNHTSNVTQDTTDEKIITYFSNFSSEIDNTTTFKDSIKEKFVAVVDFIFYDGTIKGKTFKELSDKTKLKVLQLFLKIDNKIEEKFPNYKNNISTTGNKVYTNAKNKAIETYFELITKVCNNDQELCNTAKAGLKDLKDSFSLTWDFIKKISGIGITELKDWYEIWREI